MPQAQHSKAGEFVRRGIFAGVRDFVELERRIAALPDEQSRGAAFEVFAEAYLATQRRHDAATVWPLTAVPTQTLQTLGLSSQDYGVDGVFQTRLGHFNAYQVKFRTGRPALTWRELSTFMGLADSPHIRSRVLLTNCDDLPPVLNERQGFFCIRGSDLDRMETDDFRALEAWLAHADFVAPRKQPQPHQTEALAALLPALDTHDRVSAIMACGTGKTLVALWIAERRQAARILVLVPSLALLRQTLHEWLRETSLPSLAYLCVCSDPTVKNDLDALATAQSDLDFQVSTDSRSVREFLDASFTGAKIVFSTYQSAHVVGAALKPGETFDLGIFDEAHKTAGREGRNFAFALDDKNLALRKRLFLTATPRHYNPLRKDKEGDAQLVFSMDKPDVYGPQAYRLTFAEAARRGIICGYRVIISVITSGMVTNELLSRGEVLVNGDAIRARQVANQLALKDAIAKYGVNKVFTFHSTVASAASFVADGSEGVRTHLLEFETFHVNGTMTTAGREREMHDYRAAARAVMSNARCLTEGVDVPAVDMIAFLSPRRSRVDIVQATGRAMRRAPNKTTGYVLVPLYVEQVAGETIEQAVSRAEFDDVWDVLQSLQEQDEVLAEIIREMREERGRTKGFDDSRFREQVEILGSGISLENLRWAITTACVEKLGFSWDEYFGQLKAFRARFDHCNVPQNWDENPALSFWVSNQRQRHRLRKLNPGRERRLSEIGFIWNAFDATWEEGFSKLLQYKQQHGDCNVRRGPAADRDLANWVHSQRKARRDGRLSDEQVRRLTEQGFIWEPFDATWEEMLSALMDYKKKEGHLNVPQGWRENPRLASWVSTQRKIKNKGQLSDERIRRLKREGFIWNRAKAYRAEMLIGLGKFKAQYRHCNVPAKWPEDPRLGTWVHDQRKKWRRGKMDDGLFGELTGLGFEWQIKKRRSGKL